MSQPPPYRLQDVPPSPDQNQAGSDPGPAGAWRPFPLQMVLSVIVLCVVGIVTVGTGSTYDGFASMIGYLIVPPLMAGFTLVGAVIVGLPFRFYGPLRRWWKRHTLVMPVVAASGALLLIGSYILGSTQYVQDPEQSNSPPFELWLPLWQMWIAGWLALAFGMVHIWWTTKVPQGTASTQTISPL